MNKNELYDAVSGINKEYIEASDDFEAVAADFRREKNRRIKKIVMKKINAEKFSYFYFR